MTPFRLILLLLLILVAVVVVLVVLRRGSAQRDAQRVEAAGLRADADTMATTVAGQSVFADQAAQRAELARVEAEDKASEAARLEAEAAEHRAAAEAGQRDYEATLRRADDIDPDVKQSEFLAPAEAGAAAAAVARDDDDVPMTRAARREAREAEVSSDTGSASVAPSTAAAATVGGVAAGTTAWTGRGDDESTPESERIASAADYRDDVPDDTSDSAAGSASPEPGEATSELEPRRESESESGEVYAADGTGTGSDMSNDAHTDTAEHPPHEEGLEAGQAASAGAGGAYAATRALHEEHSEDAGVDDTSDAAATPASDAADATDADEHRSEPADDLSRDVESPRGEWGGPPQDEPAEMTVVDPEAYAATEPLMASEQGAPVQPEAVDSDGDTSGGETSDVETTEERYDPTPTRDWAADEGELLEKTHDRGDRLEAERADLAQASEAPTAADDTTDAAASGDVTDAAASDHATDAPASDHATDAPASDESGSTATGGRRISGFEELRDGGFGVGSAAPLDDGAQPLDHPVAAYRDTMTYRVPGDAGYDSAEPHVWFYDEGAAERSGFRRSEG